MSATKLKKRRKPSVSPLTTNTEIEAHKSLQRYQTRELRQREAELTEKKAVAVVISKDGEEALSQKELYKKRIAKHNEKRKANGGESPAESPEVVAKPRPKRAKLKLLVTQTQPKPPSPACTTSFTSKGESIKSPGQSFAALKPPPKPSLENQPKQHLVKPDLSKQTWKRFSSFDQTSQTSSSSGVSGNSSNISSTGSSLKRVKSSPVVSQIRSQEEIERKRKEAMAKREEMGRRRKKSEEEAERKRREEAEKMKEEVDKKRKEEVEKYNKSLMREAEEKRLTELRLKEEAQGSKESKDKEEAAKKMKEEIERKKREAKERLARSRSQQSQQQGIHIGTALR